MELNRKYESFRELTRTDIIAMRDQISTQGISVHEALHLVGLLEDAVEAFRMVAFNADPL